MKAENQMTPEQAVSFDGYSAGNAMVVRASLPCGCEPYVDVFTYRRWQAQGCQVKRGEHGIKIAKVVATTREDKETGEKRDSRYLGSATVFCRHQIERKRGTGPLNMSEVLS